MIDLYTWTTPNGRKVSILLEELGLPYSVHPVNIGKDEQFAPEFLAISPNNKIPAIFDHDSGLGLMESGAIMVHLAEKHGRFLPQSGEARVRVLEWLMWQMGGLGPMLGQAHHFARFNPGVAPYAEERYLGEAQRLYKVLDTHLDGRDFIAGDYSIADMAIWPWIARFEWQKITLSDFTNVRTWYQRLAGRDVVRRGFGVPETKDRIPEG